MTKREQFNLSAQALFQFCPLYDDGPTKTYVEDTHYYIFDTTLRIKTSLAKMRPVNLDMVIFWAVSEYE